MKYKYNNIAIVTPHFFPENFIINDIAKKLVNLGMNITVITGLPNYPKGKIFKGYEKIKKLFITKKNGIKIIRFPIIPRKSGSSLNLLINYLSFIVNGIFFIKPLLKTKKFDHVFVYGISPITSALLAIYIKKKIKVKLTIWIQDLWPESVKMSGHIKNSIILKIISYVVKYIYENCDNLIAQSESFKKNLKKYTSKKIYVVENFSFNKKIKRAIVPKKVGYLLNNYKCFVFAGNVGKVQSLETIVNSAKILNKKKNIIFLIIGHGSNLHKIKLLRNKYNLKNIFFFGPYKIDTVLEILRKSEAQLLTLKKDKDLSLYIPQKFSMYLLSGKPIIIAANGEVLKLTNKYKVGLTGSAENFKKLAQNILKISTLNKLKKNEIKKNSKKLFEDKFNLTKQTLKIINIINY